MPEDQQVAEALGMTKAAFSERKRKGSFPSERVVAAKGRHPRLDVSYVLAGARGGPGAMKIEAMLAASAAQSPAVRQAAVDAALGHADDMKSAADKHRSLVEMLPWCDDEALELLIQIAARFAAGSGRRVTAHEVGPGYKIRSAGKKKY